MADTPVKAGTVELADGSSVDYEEVAGERVAWVTQVGYRGCGHAETLPSAGSLRTAGFRRLRRIAFLDAAGRCPPCAEEARARAREAAGLPAAPTPPKPLQNVPTGLPCPRPGCRGKLLIMTRKKDGHEFLACSAWYGDARCDYTQNEVPEHVRAKRAGVPMLPLPGLE